MIIQPLTTSAIDSCTKQGSALQSSSGRYTVSKRRLWPSLPPLPRPPYPWQEIKRHGPPAIKFWMTEQFTDAYIDWGEQVDEDQLFALANASGQSEDTEADREWNERLTARGRDEMRLKKEGKAQEENVEVEEFLGALEGGRSMSCRFWRWVSFIGGR